MIDADRLWLKAEIADRVDDLAPDWMERAIDAAVMFRSWPGIGTDHAVMLATDAVRTVIEWRQGGR